MTYSTTYTNPNAVKLSNDVKIHMQLVENKYIAFKSLNVEEKLFLSIYERG